MESINLKNILYIFLITTVGFMCPTYHVNAQTHEEKKQAKTKMLIDSLNAARQRQIDAAAKRRQQVANKNNEAVFGDDDPIFKQAEIPEKWENQSAVMLACKSTYRYYVNGSSACFDRVERKKIKVLDKSAIDNLSTFYFIPTNDVGFRLIKKDGTIKNISLNDAVPVDEYMPVPIAYMVEGSVDYTYSKSYKKLAISGIEPGDIIDYYYKFSSSSYQDKVSILPFLSVALTLTGEYPIVSQKIVLRVDTGFFINFASYNGAAVLTKLYDHSVGSTTYVLKDTDRDKSKDEKWEYAMKSEPAIKFQVVYSTSKEKDEIPYFLGNSSAPISSVSSTVKKVANEIALETNSTIEDYSSSIIRYMRRNYGNVKDPVLYMKYAYAYFRYFLMIGNTGENNESNFSEDFDENLQEKYAIKSEVFAKTMGLVCRDKDIPYDILFGVPSNMGTLDNLIYPSELRWVLYVKGSPGIYLYPFDSYKVPGEAANAMEGIDMYTLLPDKKLERAVMNKTKTPISQTADNIANYTSDITLNVDMQGGAIVERKAKITGLVKERYYPEVIAEAQLLNKELKRYKEVSIEDYLKKIHNDGKRKEEERKITLVFADEQKNRLETMKDFITDDFDVNSYDNFQLVSDGRQVDSSKLIFNDDFKIKDVVHKVGLNYIVDVGKFIGKQTKIKEEQRTRYNDIYLGCAAEYDNEIHFTIPKGYTLQGVDALNKNITNETGGFISTASIQGNTLVIKTRKYYLHNFEPKDSWSDMLNFLDAAYDYTQSKVLLKKT